MAHEEFNQPVQPAASHHGETFADIRELKHVLATAHAGISIIASVKKCLRMRSVGRSKYYDVPTLDQLVAQLEATGGRPSALLQGIVIPSPSSNVANCPDVNGRRD